ncbi:MAG: hypothetical protein AAGA57_00775 [Planctomycetota bacterium]
MPLRGPRKADGFVKIGSKANLTGHADYIGPVYLSYDAAYVLVKKRGISDKQVGGCLLFILGFTPIGWVLLLGRTVSRVRSAGRPPTPQAQPEQDAQDASWMLEDPHWPLPRRAKMLLRFPIERCVLVKPSALGGEFRVKGRIQTLTVPVDLFTLPNAARKAFRDFGWPIDGLAPTPANWQDHLPDATGPDEPPPQPPEPLQDPPHPTALSPLTPPADP